MKNLFNSLVSTFIIQVVTVVGGVLSARVLLPEGKGALTAILLWPSLLAAIGNLGLIEAATFFASDARNGSSKIVASGLILTGVLALPLVVAGYLIMPWVLAHYNSDVIYASRLYLVYIPINFATLTMAAILLGRLAFFEYNVIRTLVHVCTVVGMLALYALHGASAGSFAMASLLANVITLAAAAWAVWHRGWLQWQFDWATAQRLLRYGLKVHLGSLVSLATMRLDQILMSLFLKPTALGLYVVAITVAAGASIIASTIGMVAFPHLASLASEQAKSEVCGRFFRLTILSSLACAVVLWVMDPWILAHFFGRAYLPVAGTTRILIAAAVLQGAIAVITAFFKAFNRPLMSSAAQAINLMVAALGLWALLPRYEYLGAAWASLLSASATAVFMICALRRQTGIAWAGLLWPTSGDWESFRAVCHKFMMVLGVGRPTNAEVGPE
jgi:O-antigen/teichoic acid export membrane protein